MALPNDMQIFRGVYAIKSKPAMYALAHRPDVLQGLRDKWIRPGLDGAVDLAHRPRDRTGSRSVRGHVDAGSRAVTRAQYARVLRLASAGNKRPVLRLRGLPWMSDYDHRRRPSVAGK